MVISHFQAINKYTISHAPQKYDINRLRLLYHIIQLLATYLSNIYNSFLKKRLNCLFYWKNYLQQYGNASIKKFNWKQKLYYSYFQRVGSAFSK